MATQINDYNSQTTLKLRCNPKITFWPMGYKQKYIQLLGSLVKVRKHVFSPSSFLLAGLQTVWLELEQPFQIN